MHLFSNTAAGEEIPFCLKPPDHYQQHFEADRGSIDLINQIVSLKARARTSGNRATKLSGGFL